MRSLLCFALMLFPLASFANSGPEQLFKIRYQAFAISSELLLYYNPHQGAGDPRRAEGYRRGVARLQRLVGSGPMVLQEAASELQRLTEILEAQPSSADQVMLRPTWINPILESQASLDREAERLYNALPDDPRRSLHALQLDLARLLLLYQTRTFGSLGVYLTGTSDDSFVRLDQQITAGFDSLRSRYPSQASELDALRRKYDFIRPRLLDHSQVWVPESAFYYLDAIARRLDALDVP
ncbi:hypothetical protein [Aeromonas dhakensis]|uniref:hypothetical protein n=1 Tax=Aeromonas dhakensis TaxID=196024 RepID=UPI0035710782